MNLSYPAYLRVFFPAAEVALVRGSVGPWSNMAKKGARAWEMDVFWKVGWWWSFIVHHNFCWCIFFSLKFARCVMWVSKIVNHPDLPFLFFSQRCKFFWVRKNCSCSISPSKKAVGSFRPRHAAATCPGIGPMACHGGSHMFRRDHLGAETAQDDARKEYFPQGPCCFWALAVEDSENSSSTKDHYDA